MLQLLDNSMLSVCDITRRLLQEKLMLCLTRVVILLQSFIRTRLLSCFLFLSDEIPNERTKTNNLFPPTHDSGHSG